MTNLKSLSKSEKYLKCMNTRSLDEWDECSSEHGKNRETTLWEYIWDMSTEVSQNLEHCRKCPVSSGHILSAWESIWANHCHYFFAKAGISFLQLETGVLATITVTSFVRLSQRNVSVKVQTATITNVTPYYHMFKQITRLLKHTNYAEYLSLCCVAERNL